MKRLQFLACPVLLLLAGCSTDQPKTGAAPAPKEPEKPAEPVSAQSAVHQMWVKARSWNADAKPLRVVNMNLREVKTHDGLAGGWEAFFVSEARGKSRRYTYSVVEIPPASISKGVFAGAEDNWSPGGQARPFAIQAFKIDSPAAYETALKNGGAEFTKKNPDMPILYLLENTKRFPNPAWRVIWGESVSTSSFSVFVDATTGAFLQKTR